MSIPIVSVVVPTAGRPEQLARLLAGLERQTVPPRSFEVVVTDDGSDPPAAAAFEGRTFPFPLTFLRQERSGPAAARNRAIAVARGRILLIVNDDAGVPPDLLARHVAAQDRAELAGNRRAFLGGFDFAPDCVTPLVRTFDKKGFVFPFHLMRRDAPNPGRFFWTCNLSVPRADVVAAGGFDENFRKPVCEDVELGYRLERRGVLVEFLEGAPCLHHHRVDARWFARRQVELACEMVRMWRKHGDPELLPWTRANVDEATEIALLRREARLRGNRFFALAEKLDKHFNDPQAPMPEGAVLELALSRVNEDAMRLGLIAGLSGESSAQVWNWLNALPPATTVVAAASADPERDVETLRVLRRRADAPVEFLVIGGQAGAPEQRPVVFDKLPDAYWLAPAADPLRRRVATTAHGQLFCFLKGPWDGDVGWLESAVAKYRSGIRPDHPRFTLLSRDELTAATE